MRCIPTIPTHVEFEFVIKNIYYMLVKTTCRPESIESAENRHDSQMSATYYYLYCFDMNSFHWMRKLYLFFPAGCLADSKSFLYRRRKCQMIMVRCNYFPFSKYPFQYVFTVTWDYLGYFEMTSNSMFHSFRWNLKG